MITELGSVDRSWPIPCVIRHIESQFGELNLRRPKLELTDSIARFMAQAETHFQLLYVSQLAPHCDFGVMKEIVAVARQRNAMLGLTGALLFDGERFCQLLEGSESTVQSMMRSIQRDPRHTAVRVLFAAPSTAATVMNRWASGYCDAQELDALDALDGPAESGHSSAVDKFIAVLNRADTV